MNTWYNSITKIMLEITIKFSPCRPRTAGPTCPARPPLSSPQSARLSLRSGATSWMLWAAPQRDPRPPTRRSVTTWAASTARSAGLSTGKWLATFCCTSFLQMFFKIQNILNLSAYGVAYLYRYMCTEASLFWLNTLITFSPLCIKLLDHITAFSGIMWQVKKI